MPALISQPVCCDGIDYGSRCEADCECGKNCDPGRCSSAQRVTGSELKQGDDVLEFVGLDNGKESVIVNIGLIGIVMLMFMCCIAYCYCKKIRKYRESQRVVIDSEGPGYETVNGVGVDEENLMEDK